MSAAAGVVRRRPRAAPRLVPLVLALGLAAAAIGSTRAAEGPSDTPVVIRVDPAHGHDRPVTGGRPVGPVATLEGALDLVARLRAQRPAAPVAIELAAGVVRLAHAVTLGPEHGGTAGAPLVIRGASGGATELSGSVALDPVSMPLPASIAARLPAEARDHVRLYRLPPGALDRPTIQNMSLLRDRPATVALEVYDGQGALVPARWPNEGWAHVVTGSTAADDPAFTVDDARIQRWRGEPDLWAEGFWRWDWLFEALPVAGTDVATRRVTLPQLPYEGIRAGARFRITHALSELDRPGEWWRDTAHGLLVAWPRDRDGRIEVAVTGTLLDIEGAAHVRIENLTLDHARGDLVAVKGARDVVISHSTLRWAAARGVAFQADEDSGLEDCTLTGLGGTAVQLEGGDRKTLTRGGLFVRRSRFATFARLVLTQQPAIEVDGVGALVDGNLFEDAGAPALILHGNDHRIVGNELTRLLAGISDNGAIYAGRDWTARGTVIEGNFLHDIRADPGFESKGVYLDDFASGFTIRRNLFVRVDKPVFLGGGRDNLVAGNVFVASSPAIHVDSRGQTWATSSITDPDSELMGAYNAMPVGSALWRSRYPGLAGILADEPAVGKDNRLSGNTFVLSEPFDFSDGGQRSRQVIGTDAGPAGVRSASGLDLSALAAQSRDPRAFADIVDADGRPVGIDLGAVLRGPRP